MPDTPDPAHPGTLSLRHRDGTEQDLTVITPTEGAPGVDIGGLLAKGGLVTYDPGFVNTAACSSKITYIDGDAGILRYRGYPIDQLAEHSTFVEVAYLLIYGELPTAPQLDAFTNEIRRHTVRIDIGSGHSRPPAEYRA